MEYPQESVTTACDAGPIDPFVKEAVAESIMNDVYRRVSGEGAYGEIVMGEKPEERFVSGFLIALDPGDEEQQARPEDVENSPIRIGALGMDVGITADCRDPVRIKAEFSIYVRLLPRADELRRDRNPVRFILTSNTRREIRQEVYDRCRAERENFNLRTTQGRQEWANRKQEIREEANRNRGVLTRPQETIPDDSQDSEEQPGGYQGADVFTVAPGEPFPMRDILFESARPVGKWLRLEIESPVVEFDLGETSAEIRKKAEEASNELTQAVRARIDQWLESRDSLLGGKLWAYPRRPNFTPSEVSNWEATLQGIRNDILSLPLNQRRERVAPHGENLELRWSVQVQEDWSDPNRKSLHVALENWSRTPQRNRISDQGLYQVTVFCSMSKRLHQPMRLERVKPSYRYNAYLDYPALGYNCGIKRSSSDDMVFLQTTWLPTYNLPKIEPQHHHIDMSFRSFADPENCKRQGEMIVEKLRGYIEQIKQTVDYGRGLSSDQTEAIRAEEIQFKRDLEKWKCEADMIQRGVSLLSESLAADPESVEAAPFKAFALMNKTMEKVGEGKYRGWRLFQIAFILSSLPALASRIPVYARYYREDWDTSTTLLYFATGGGKTEAFMGLLVFGLFLDRLRGKERGVTSMIRYPLRLLTIQQAQRASRFLAEAEKLRIEHDVPGEPFSIGFWVGGSNTPNRLSEREYQNSVRVFETTTQDEDELSKDRKYRLARERWVKLSECPFCEEAPLGIRRFNRLDGQGGYVCHNAECWWNVNHPGKPLPFHFIDDDIYAMSPSVLLGTVDKLALIGQHFNTIRRVLGMFGAPTWFDPVTNRYVDAIGNRQALRDGPGECQKEGVFPAYTSGMRIVFDPFPSLIIQDEAHLLEESLGTFTGLFETTLIEVFRRLGAKMNGLSAKDPDGNIRMPKVVVASATVSEPERQVENLYQQGLIQFPHHGPDLNWSFYAAPTDHLGNFLDLRDPEEIERLAMKRRVYASILTNGKPHTTGAASILSAFHFNITRLMQDLGSGDLTHQQRGKERLATSLLPGDRQGRYRQAIDSASPGELATMVDMHRVALTYVTNKKGGDQIQSTETQEVQAHHRKNGIDLQGRFAHDLITGSVDVARIKKIVDRVKNRPDPGDSFPAVNEVLRSVVATSAVSHGVDVEQLNTMFFAGMPSKIAEYIQASSRVGRTHVGLSFLIPVPQRKRDRYIVEIHDIFHRFLERMVRPAAIDRWAENAIDRVVPSFFQTYMCGVRLMDQFISLDDGEKHNVQACKTVDDIATMDREVLQRDISDFICRGIGLHTRYSSHANTSFCRDRIEGKVKDLLSDIREPDKMAMNLADFFKEISSNGALVMYRPMTSLRDVDEAGTLLPDWYCDSLRDKELNDIMNFLRRGAGASGDDTIDV